MAKDFSDGCKQCDGAMADILAAYFPSIVDIVVEGLFYYTSEF
jgi:hypothetical protein